MKTPGIKSYGLATVLSLGLAAASQGVSAGCVYKITNDWGAGLTGEIVITNSGSSAVSGWNIGWQYATNRITSSWNVGLSGSNPYTASNIGWNGNLQPGQSVSFGFQVDKRGGSAEVPSITGSICSGTVTSSVAPSSTPVRSSSSTAVVSSSNNNNNGGQQCNWYGTIIPLCANTASGWGWENNQTCVSRSVCTTIVNGTSSATPSSTPVVSSSSRSSSSVPIVPSSSSSSNGNNQGIAPLVVQGNKVTANGQPANLAGMSLFWSNTGWGGEKYYNAQAVAWLKTDWKANLVRAAMGVDEAGGYLADPSNKTRTMAVVDAAIANNMYVIIDWHTHHAEDNKAAAIAFFKEMATKYGSYNNVIYEVYNEPLQVSWSSVIKPYATDVIREIRAIDPDNLIIVGTPSWSQDVDVAANDPITAYTNIAYTLHFYSGTHKQFLRDKAQTALSKGIALFVTEWGSVNADGNGAVDTAETNAWLSFLKTNGISHANWALNDKAEGSSALTPGASANGGWSSGQLTASGALVRNAIITNNGGTNNSSSPVTSTSSSVSSINTNPSTIAPDNAKIRYNGRVSVNSTAALYDWANTQIEFKANAPQVELLLNDNKNDYNLFVDGQFKNKITGTGNMSVPVTLGAGDHTVLLTKRTGPNFGSGQFLGLKLPQGGQLLDLPAAPARKIEFIGDSFTVGYGNEGPGLTCSSYRPYENAYLSYAPIAARALGAQSRSIAISGFGAVRNYGDANTTSPTPMPFYYNRTVMERSDLVWNFASWIPDAVVIKLGTNDHSTQPEPSADVFIQGIHKLISQVTAGYGQVPIFLLADSSLPQLVSRMQTAAAQQRSMGNSKVNFVQVTFPPQSQLGCDWHPAVAGHEAMAAELVAAMKPILNWQNNDNNNNNNNNGTDIGTASVTNFKGGAKAAYSMVLDDYCGSWTSGIDDYAIPTLMERGLRAGLGALASECEKNNFQARLKTVAQQGFEIVNHTWTHPALVPCSSKPDPNQACSDVRPDLSVEIDKARDFLKQASGAPVDFFVFPYNSVDDVVLNHLKSKGYLGARGGGYTMNAANFSDPFRLNLLGNQADMNALANQAVASGSFALINLHGIADASYEPVPLATWVSHLDYLKTLVAKNDLWVDNPTAIVKYNRSKALCGSPQISGNTLTFSGSQTGCSTYATGLTVNITSNAGVPDLRPTQNGTSLSTRRISANSVLVENVDPRYSTTLN
ncbi:MAG TPA: cellulase family glycosylhydrolase [Cellvibrio sp.]|nr:cellulase family glycosylhydrolase [Cellvibrio sp.]